MFTKRPKYKSPTGNKEEKEKMKMICVIVLAIVALGGCSAKLVVYDQDGKVQKGVPIRTPVLVEITSKTIYEIDPSISTSDPKYETIKILCEPTTKQTTSFMPLGNVSYVNYDPATFAKSEFKVVFTDTGATKSISVNSDPSSTTESAATLLGTVLPFFKAPKAVPSTPFVPGTVDLEELRKKSCIVKKTIIENIKERKLDQ